MKLYEAPKGSKIKVKDSDLECIFIKLDGMYSVCILDNSHIIHLAAFTDVEIIDETKSKERLEV